MDEKITIIEGPPPTFETVGEGWVLSLHESPLLADVAVTRLRTFNGPALVERCHRAWRAGETTFLEFRSSDGLEQKAPILAARSTEVDEGHLLILWVRLNEQDVELEMGYSDDSEEDDEDLSDLP